MCHKKRCHKNFRFFLKKQVSQNQVAQKIRRFQKFCEGFAYVCLSVARVTKNWTKIDGVTKRAVTKNRVFSTGVTKGGVTKNLIFCDTRKRIFCDTPPRCQKKKKKLWLNLRSFQKKLCY